MKRHFAHKCTEVVCIALFALVFVGCATDSGQRDERSEEHAQALAELAVKHDSTLNAYKGMAMVDLVDRMEENTRQGREPFNSSAYREITVNRADKGPELLRALETRQAFSYLSLLALRTVNPQGYGAIDSTVKMNAFIGELARSKSYNRWGLPHLYWEAAAEAIIELGETAQPGLKALLTDKSPAPVWGSEEVLEYEAYQYRRCDYALAMIMAIRGEDLKRLPRQPEGRDRIIQAMLDE